MGKIYRLGLGPSILSHKGSNLTDFRSSPTCVIESPSLAHIEGRAGGKSHRSRKCTDCRSKGVVKGRNCEENELITSITYFKLDLQKLSCEPRAE